MTGVKIFLCKKNLSRGFKKNMRVNSIQLFSNSKTITLNCPYNQGSKAKMYKNTAVFAADTFTPSFGSNDIETLIFDLEEKKYRRYKCKNHAIDAMKEIAAINQNDLLDGKLINGRYFAVVADRVTNSNGKIDSKRLAESVKNARLRIEKNKPASYGAFYLINKEDVIRCDTPEDGAKLVEMKPSDFRARLKQNPKMICGYAIVYEEKLLDSDGKIDENKVEEARKMLEIKKQKKPSVRIPVYLFRRGKKPERFDSTGKAALELEAVPATVKKAMEEDGFVRRDAMIVPANKLEDENGNPIPEKMKEAEEKFAKRQGKK